jgi:uncharacterized protein (TIGR00251 family)
VDQERRLISIRLTPNASKNAITGWDKDVSGNDILKISVTAIPENGKANQALIKLLSKTWKIAKSEIVIVKGETERHKILSVPKTLDIGEI